MRHHAYPLVPHAAQPRRLDSRVWSRTAAGLGTGVGRPSERMVVAAAMKAHASACVATVVARGAVGVAAEAGMTPARQSATLHQ